MVACFAATDLLVQTDAIAGRSASHCVVALANPLRTQGAKLAEMCADVVSEQRTFVRIKRRKILRITLPVKLGAFVNLLAVQILYPLRDTLEATTPEVDDVGASMSTTVFIAQADRSLDQVVRHFLDHLDVVLAPDQCPWLTLLRANQW